MASGERRHRVAAWRRPGAVPAAGV